MDATDGDNFFSPAKEAAFLHGQALDLIAESNAMRTDGGKLNREKCREALPLLEMAVSLDPGDSAIRSHLGTVLKTLGHDDAALHHLGKTLQANPQASGTRIDVLNVLIKKRRYDEAIPLAEEGTKLHPRDSVLWYTHAHCCLSVKRYEEALKSGKKALETATPEDHGRSSEYKNSIVKIILLAREGIRAQSIISRIFPSPG